MGAWPSERRSTPAASKSSASDSNLDGARRGGVSGREPVVDAVADSGAEGLTVVGGVDEAVGRAVADLIAVEIEIGGGVGREVGRVDSADSVAVVPLRVAEVSLSMLLVVSVLVPIPAKTVDRT